MTAEIPVGPWRAAFDEAWASWCAGNFGIGAVLFDPEADEIVTRGRNRVEEQPGAPGQIAGNFMAHAEMNAFAVLPVTYTAVRWRDDPFLERFHQANPDLAPCAEQIVADGTLAAVRDGGGSVIDALDAVRHRLSAR